MPTNFSDARLGAHAQTLDGWTHACTHRWTTRKIMPLPIPTAGGGIKINLYKWPQNSNPTPICTVHVFHSNRLVSSTYYTFYHKKLSYRLETGCQLCISL